LHFDEIVRAARVREGDVTKIGLMIANALAIALSLTSVAPVIGESGHINALTFSVQWELSLKRSNRVFCQNFIDNLFCARPI